MSRIRRFVCMNAIVLSVAFVGAASAGPADSLPWVDRLPADTTHYAFRAGSDVLGAKLEGTPAGEIIGEEEVAEFLRSLSGMFDKHPDDTRRKVWRLVKNAFYSDIVCAHIPAKEDDEPEIVCVAIPRSDKRRDELKSAFDAVVKIMLEELDEDPEEYGEEVPGGVIYDRIGWVSDRLVLFHGDRARRVVLGEKPKSSLAESGAFKKATGSLKLDNPVGFYFYNLEPLWNLSTDNEKAAPDSFGGKLVASGLTSLTAMAGASNVAQGRYHNEHFWVVDARKGGLFKHVQDNPIPAKWLEGIPDEAVSFTYGTWDPESFLRLFLDPGEEEDDDDGDEAASDDRKPAPATRPQASNSLGKLAGYDLDPAMVRSLGTRYLIQRLPAEGTSVNPAVMFFPPFLVLPPHQMVFALEIKDRPTFERTFAAFWEEAAADMAKKGDEGNFMFGSPKMRTMKYRGQTIYELSYMVGAYFHITDDQLLISTNPQLIKNAIRRSGKPGASLADSAEFKAAYAKVPKDACFLVYLHKQSFFETLYKGYLGLAQQFGPIMMATAGGQGVDFSFADLPSTRIISRHIKQSAYLYGVAKKDGVLFDGQADLLPLSWWIAQIQIVYDTASTAAHLR